MITLYRRSGAERSGAIMAAARTATATDQLHNYGSLRTARRLHLESELPRGRFGALGSTPPGGDGAALSPNDRDPTPERATALRRRAERTT